MQLSRKHRRPSRPRQEPSQHLGQTPTSARTNQMCLSVIPVRLDRSPGQVCWSNNCNLDASGSTVSVVLDRVDSIPVRSVVVGASTDGPRRGFSMMTIQTQEQLGDQLRLQLSNVVDPDEDLFSEQNLAPRIDADSFSFCYGCPEDILSKWESIGVLRKYLVDRILVCPDCNSIPTWRQGCFQCGSGRYKRPRLIHHYACAHVDHAETFQSPDGTLRCPKCQVTRLIAGTDFQYVAGPVTCFDCDASGSQPTLYCMCHRCLSRFQPNMAHEQELLGYHADRLDLLDFLAAF